MKAVKNKPHRARVHPALPRLLLVGAVTLCLLGALIGYGVIMKQTGQGIPCLIRSLTGLRCPGCGLSHALASLLSGDVRAALGHHLLFPLYVVWAAWTYLGTVIPYLRGRPLRPGGPPVAVHVAVLIAAVVYTVIRNLA